MRNSPSRTRDAVKNGRAKKSIVVCLSELDACIGLPFRGPSSISAIANRRAVEVLRREVRIAALTGGAEGMHDIEVVSLEVGTLEIPPFDGGRMLNYDLKEYVKSWTPSEKLTYGPGWEHTLDGSNRKYKRRAANTKAPNVDQFVGDLVQIVSYGRVHFVSFCGLRLHVGSVFGWLRGGRYSVGPDGNVVLLKPGDPLFADMSSLRLPLLGVDCAIMSTLPGAILDFIINIPFYCLSLHQSFVASHPDLAPRPTSPPATTAELPSAPTPAPAPVSRPLPPRPLPTPPVAPTPASATVVVAKETVDSVPSSEHEHEASENGSEADVESNDGAGVSESWVSLQPNPTMASSETITA